MAFLPLGNSDHVVVSVSIDFPANSVGIGIAFESFERCSLDSVLLLLLLVNFVSGFRLELMYISLIVSIRPNLTHLHGFQLLVLQPSLFCLYQQNNTSESEVKFRQASNHYEKVLEAAKLAYADKKGSITSQKLGSWHFWQIANIVLN